MIEGTSPKIVTSRRRIKYVRSKWRVHEFEIWSTEMICRVVTLRMKDSVLVWLGSKEEPALGELALGVPAPGAPRAALASALLGADGALTTSMARRLAATLNHPAYVACGSMFDRFTLPLVERALITEIKSSPECFWDLTTEDTLQLRTATALLICMDGPLIHESSSLRRWFAQY